MAEVTLRGRAFPARERPSEWELMKLAYANDRGSPAEMMAATYRFIRHVLGDSWAEFESYVDELSEDDQVDLDAELESIIGDYLVSVGDQAGKPSKAAAAIDAAVAADAPAARVYSLERGWVDTDTEPGKPDGSEASAAEAAAESAEAG